MNSGSAGTKRNKLDIPRLCRNLAEASPMPTASIDGTTRVVAYANPAFCSLVKQRSDELVGKSFSAIAPDGEECLLLLDRVFQTGHPEIHAGNEHSAPHPFYWSYAIWPILADDDRVTGALIQVTETTTFHKQVIDMNEALLIGSIRQHELAQAADALNVLLQAENKARSRAEDELRRANHDLHECALAASHDLQEPLRMVIGFSDLLRKGYEGHLTGDGLDYLDFITTGARQMRQLLRDLLAYARAGKEEDDEPAQLIDLNVVMEQVLDNIAWSVEENGGSLTCEVLPAVEGYSAHFVQVFQNLLGNAIKYRGERPLIIRIFAEKLGEEWRFAVADNGMGIDPKYHQQVFGVFKRLHRDAIPGTGIGLAICQRVVERYGGRIWVESEIDQGSTFYFTLPFRQDHLLQPIAVNPLVES
jgi:signal transduction histidine kinase